MDRKSLSVGAVAGEPLQFSFEAKTGERGHDLSGRPFLLLSCGTPMSLRAQMLDGLLQIHAPLTPMLNKNDRIAASL